MDILKAAANAAGERKGSLTSDEASGIAAVATKVKSEKKKRGK